MCTRRVSSIGIALLLLSILRPSLAQAGARQRVLTVSRPSSPLAFTFIGAEAGLIDTGTIVWRGGSKRSVVTTRRVTMRIGEASRDAHGTARLRAYLETPDARCTIRINGIVLGTAPRTIQSNAPIGIPFTHRIEIEVPINAAEGPLQAAIGWEASTD